VAEVGLLVEVAFREALHVGGAVGILRGGNASEDLEIGGGKVMVGVGIKLALVLSSRRHRHRHVGGVRIGLAATRPSMAGFVARRAPSMWSKARFSIIRTTMCLRFWIPGRVLSSMASASERWIVFCVL